MKPKLGEKIVIGDTWCVLS